MPILPQMRDLFRPSRHAVLLVGAVVALLLAGFAAVVVDAQRESRRGLEERFRLRSALAANFVASFLHHRARQERDVAKARLAEPRVARDEFEAVVEGLGLDAAVLLDRAGRVLHVYPHRADLIGEPIAQQYAHLRGALHGRTEVSDVVPSAARRVPVVAVAVPFVTSTGLRVFSGAMRVDRSPIAAFLRNAIPLRLGSARLFDSKGTLVAGTGRVSDDAFVAPAEIRSPGWRVELAAPRPLLYAPVTGLAQWAPWALFAGLLLAAVAVLLLMLRLVSSQAALRERNREVLRLMRVQQDFVATTAHELRTPLTSVVGFVDVLLAGKAGPLATEQANFLEVVRRNAGRIHDLVADLLLAAQLDARKLELRPEPLTLEEVARETIEDAHPVAEQKRVQLELTANGGAPVVADRKLLARVVGNLVSNAVKYTPAEGRVHVHAFAENGHAVIEVSDTGIGIPAAEQQRLFERFFRSSTALERDIPGTGLGLAISRDIISLHGGRLVCRSVEGEGSTFRVELPRSE